jgi:hypothetical protein
MANANYINDTTGNFSPVNPRQLAMQAQQGQSSSGGGASKFLNTMMNAIGPQVDSSGGSRGSGMASAVISAVTGGAGGSKFLGIGGGVSSKNSAVQPPPGFGAGAGGVGGGTGASGDFNNFIDQSQLQQMELLGLQIKMQNNVTFTNLYSNLEKTRGEAFQRVIQNIRQG